MKKGGATMRTTRRRSQNERKQPNQASRGKNKIRPNKEELSEKPGKGKQNRGGWGDHGKLKKADKIERDR